MNYTCPGGDKYILKTNTICRYTDTGQTNERTDKTTDRHRGKPMVPFLVLLLQKIINLYGSCQIVCSRQIISVQSNKLYREDFIPWGSSVL